MKEALKLALEALEGVLDDAPKVLDASIAGGLYEVVQCRDAITALREALAQPEPSPEWMTEEEQTAYTFGWFKALESQRKPLTNEEIMNIAKVSCIGISPHEDTLNFAKVIEAVHGIKEKNT